MNKTISTANQTDDNNDANVKCSLAPPIPLGWTKINRRPKRKGGMIDGKTPTETETDFFFFCCEDPSCQRQEHQQRNNGENIQIGTKLEKDEHTMSSLKGKALFCLHSLDCTWFQGQFIPSSVASTSTNTISTKTSASSFGLLAVQRSDLDECLQCKDGGYREIDLTILSTSNRDFGIRGKKQRGKRRKLKVEKLQCTGGDMLRITTPPTFNHSSSNITTSDIMTDTFDNESLDQTQTQVTFDAERIITGNRVESLVKRYFPNILSDSSSLNTKRDSFSDLLPDCAIVIGDMHLQVPADFVYGRRRNIVANNGHDENITDDWLE